MSSVAPVAMGCSLLYAGTNYATDDWTVADKHPLLAVAVLAHVFFPVFTSSVYAYVYFSGSRSMCTLLLFELCIVLQVLADGFSSALMFGFRGLPIPAGVFGIACNTALCGQSWLYNSILSTTVALAYYMALQRWNEDMVQYLSLIHI